MAGRPFALILAGGGARGFAHAGVLRVLERSGLIPSALVGVSMGAIVGCAWAARSDWFEALLEADLADAPSSGAGHGTRRVDSRWHAWTAARTAWNMVRGWGSPDETESHARAALDDLFGGVDFEALRVPVVVCATDLVRGTRVELHTGPVAPAVYASSALAGILPPVRDGERLLADGVYSDMVPVDVGRRLAPVVVAVDPRQDPPVGAIHNGLQAVLRAMEVCHASHADVRFEAADLVLRPVFDDFVDVLDFGARRGCAATGMHAARAKLGALRRLLAV